MSLLVSLGTARNHVCPGDRCPLCHPGERERARPYRCPACDVYGKGSRCWSCGSADLDWNRIPADR